MVASVCPSLCPFCNRLYIVTHFSLESDWGIWGLKIRLIKRNSVKSGFNMEFQPNFGIQPGIPIPMGVNLGECSWSDDAYHVDTLAHKFRKIPA